VWSIPINYITIKDLLLCSLNTFCARFQLTWETGWQIIRHINFVIVICIKTGDPVLPICQLTPHMSFYMNGRIWYHFLGPCQAHLSLSMRVIAMTHIRSGTLTPCLHKFPKKRIRWEKPHPNRLKDPLRKARLRLRLQLVRSHLLRYSHSLLLYHQSCHWN